MKFSDSLKKNNDFLTVYRRGNKKVNHELIMYVYHNNSEMNHLGISVSKKVGNSIIRHHLTRLIREIYRLHEDMFKNGLDIVVVVRPEAANLGYHDFEKSFLHLANLQKIIK